MSRPYDVKPDQTRIVSLKVEGSEEDEILIRNGKWGRREGEDEKFKGEEGVRGMITGFGVIVP